MTILRYTNGEVTIVWKPEPSTCSLNWGSRSRSSASWQWVWCEAMAGTPAVCEHVHLPVQSGSDVVLRRMLRRYTRRRYLEILVGLRAAVPGVLASILGVASVLTARLLRVAGILAVVPPVHPLSVGVPGHGRHQQHRCKSQQAGCDS